MQENENESKPEVIVYQSDDGSFKLDVSFLGDTLWLSQDDMARLFVVERSSITKHISNIYTEGELDIDRTREEISRVLENGRTYRIQHYNLDVAISVGYRINSSVATRFRQWATQTLKEYMVKGFVMDDKRLAEGSAIIAGDYFDELTERVRRIRLSERKFYQKVQDVFSQTSYDYVPSSNDAKDFYAVIQNKFHYAVTGQTAAEIVTKRIDSGKKNAGLTHFGGAHPTVAEAKVAKNYMLEEELKRLYLISEQFLSFAELQMANKRRMLMSDWKTKLDEMLRLNDLKVLENKGSVSHENMERKVKEEIAKYQAGLKAGNEAAKIGSGEEDKK